MSKQLKNYIIMSSNDNCATALEDIPKHAQLHINENIIVLNNIILLGHKFALNDIRKGDKIKKYGQPIGFATEDIKKGDWIHTHNLSSQYLKEVLKL
ncbi:MAG: UxaA family hydrolase [Candidatus Lokiarchaeota archaeon]|nr:UxaA family hydrolase [Candidatus Lokiarchaeota archaeon]